MIQLINKIKKWLEKIFSKETFKLPENTKREIIDNKAIPNMQFINGLRTETSEEEKNLIDKFENGEISFAELTEEIRNKIINGYTLMIDKNINIMENNMRKIESAK